MGASGSGAATVARVSRREPAGAWSSPCPTTVESAAASGDERETDLPLELGDRLRDRRRTHAEAPRSPAKRALLGDRDEGDDAPKEIEIHTSVNQWLTEV